MKEEWDMQTILVCDDDKQIVEAIDIYLTGEGYQVIKAYDGYEALDALAELGRERQILLFTCQEREENYLEGRPGVTRTALRGGGA